MPCGLTYRETVGVMNRRHKSGGAVGCLRSALSKTTGSISFPLE